MCIHTALVCLACILYVYFLDTIIKLSILLIFIYFLIWLVFQIEALKAIGVTEVVLAINYQPEVKMSLLTTLFLLMLKRDVCGKVYSFYFGLILPTAGYVEFFEGF